MPCTGGTKGATKRFASTATLGIALFLALSASPAAAATCDDYSNQRDAQLAADTRDADGDGIYCEALPCPCLKPGSGDDESGPSKPPKKRKPGAQKILARVVSVTDGDTIEVRSLDSSTARRRYTVRIIGIDTPEVYGGRECGGPQASASMRRLAPSGARVRLRTDPSQDLFDRYGRLLAYVQRGKLDLGRAQIRRGWAKAYVYRRAFRRLASYRRAQREAKRDRRGVYERCGGRF